MERPDSVCHDTDGEHVPLVFELDGERGERKGEQAEELDEEEGGGEHGIKI